MIRDVWKTVLTPIAGSDNNLFRIAVYDQVRIVCNQYNLAARFCRLGVDPTVVSPGAISITATPIAYSCRDRIGHTDSRVPKSAGSAQRSRGVSASLANGAPPVVSKSSTC